MPNKTNINQTAFIQPIIPKIAESFRKPDSGGQFEQELIDKRDMSQ